MKKLLMVITLLIAAAFFVGAASAGTIDISESTVIRGNTFVLNITGGAGETVSVGYNVTNSGIMVINSQEQTSVSKVTPNGFNVTLPGVAGAKRTIYMNVTPGAKPQDYKITVLFSGGDASKVLKVTKGEIIIKTDPADYYQGNNINVTVEKNTETDNVFLFAQKNNTEEFTFIGSVNKVDNKKIPNSLAVGEYKLYGFSANLSDLNYTNYNVSFNVTEPLLELDESNYLVSNESNFDVTLTTDNIANKVLYYLVGNNHFESKEISVNDGSVSVDPTDLTAGTYIIIIQHPGKDGIFNVKSNGEYVEQYTEDGLEDKKLAKNKLAADSVKNITELINKTGVDDFCKIVNFEVSDIKSRFDNITIKEGWNLISIPRTLENNKPSFVFKEINLDGVPVLTYDPNNGWDLINDTDVIDPMTGYWVYSKTDDKINLTYTTVSKNYVPSFIGKEVYEGWNLVGIGEWSSDEGYIAKSVFGEIDWNTAKSWNTTYDSPYEYRFNTVESGTKLYPKVGYWLYVNDDGLLTGNTY